MFSMFYRGGVIGEVTQGGKTYATAPTPPAGDDSTKIATTAFVADKTAAIPSGNVAVWNRDFAAGKNNNDRAILIAPAGGTWFCWGNAEFGHPSQTNRRGRWDSTGNVCSGGSMLSTAETILAGGSSVLITNNGMAIKIA